MDCAISSTPKPSAISADLFGNSSPSPCGTIRVTTAEFMQKHVAQPSDIEPAVFRESQGFVTKEQAENLDQRRAAIWSDAMKEAQKLAEIIADSQFKLKKHDPQFKPIKPKNFTLADLLSALERSRNAYQNEDIKGAKGFLRKGFRKLGENADTFKQWLDVVPSDPQYTAPISAAFQVFLSMAGRMHTVREDIFKMMTAVPEDFNDLRDDLVVYKEVPDEKLTVKGAAVCTNIFQTLQHAMRFMGENPFKKVFKAMRLDKYESIIDDCLDQLRESKENFRKEVEKCLHSRVSSIYRLVGSSNTLQRRMMCEVAAYKDATVGAVQGSNQDIKRELLELRNVVLNAFYNNLLTDQEERKYIAERAAEEILKMQKQNVKKQKNSLGLDELLELLDFDERPPKIDVISCLSQGSSLCAMDIRRLSWIKRNQALRSWIVDYKSAPLLINGNTDTAPSAYTSVLSFLCAEMAHLFEPIQQTIVLSYFCGLHAQPTSGRRADAKGMLVSLIGQLLEHKDDKDREVFEEALVDKSLRAGIENADLDTLCDTFEALILQLPESWTVICFIDMIEFFETGKRVDETLEAVLRLLKLVKKAKKNEKVLFKLLVTAARASLVVGKEFRTRNRIWAPEVPIDSSVLQVGLSDIIRD